MASQKPYKPTAQQVKNAQATWESFTKVSSYFIYATIVGIILLALITL